PRQIVRDASLRAGRAGGQSQASREVESNCVTVRQIYREEVCRLPGRGLGSDVSRMIRLNDILERVNGYRPEADLDLIKKAYVYSAKVHQGQIRKSGEPYLIHPLEVAGLLAELKLDEASIVAGLLHDTIEDTLAKPEEIKELFGREGRPWWEGAPSRAPCSHVRRPRERSKARTYARSWWRWPK